MKLTTRRQVLAKAAAVCAAAAIGRPLVTSVSAQERPPAEHHVAIVKFKFVPDRLAVKPGDIIIWTNRDVAPHTATAQDKGWDTGAIKKGQSKSLTVTEQMPLAYYCRFHPMMKARLEIETGS